MLRPQLSWLLRRTHSPQLRPPPLHISPRTVPPGLTRAFGSAGRPSIQQQHCYLHPAPSRPAKFPRKPSYNRFSRVEQAKYLWFNSPIFRYGVIVVGIGGSIFYFANIEEVPITHRRRFNCMPEGWGDDMGNTLQQQILSQYRGKVLPASDNRVLLVAKVLNRLIPHSGLLNLEWEVHVIDEPKIMNAFVIPGGKVFVFTGILPIMKDEDGVAAVLGHEISHTVANHTAERASRGFIVVGIALLLSAFIDVSQQLSGLLLSLGYEMPNTRVQEAEADHIGLLMMAESCYDPHAAIEVWKRMEKAEKLAVPAFLSTHPTSHSRAEALTKLIPAAEAKREESQCSQNSSFNAVNEFKYAYRKAQKEEATRMQDEEFW